MVVCIVSVKRAQDKATKTKSSETGLSDITGLSAYKGEVPISQKTMPRATKRPASKDL
jgi:hypothetical protein